MKKVLFMLVVAAVLVPVLTGCPALLGAQEDSNGDTADNEPAMGVGTIEGTAQFGNTRDHMGIIVSLEAVDGARSASVSQSVASRGVSALSLVDQTTTDAEGSYRFEELAAGTYTVYASSNDSSERAVRTNVTVVEARTVTVEELLLTATGSISGTVVNGATGEGEMGWIVAVGATSYMALTGSDGSFEISGVPAGGDYPIIVMQGSRQFAGFYATVTAGETTDAGTYNVSLTADSTWHAANGAPEADQGEVGDFYLDMSDGGMYRKEAGGWVLEGHLVGAEGPAGSDGADGADGTSIQWQGTATSHPAEPELNWGYYNESEGISYIYDGTAWQILAQDGSDGADGADGAPGADGADGAAGIDGVSIQWQGTATTHPAEPELNWGYYNSADGISYIYDGTAWQILAQDGANGSEGGSTTTSLPSDPMVLAKRVSRVSGDAWGEYYELEYTYNEAGQITRRDRYGPLGQLEQFRMMEYDGDGNLTEVAQYEDDGGAGWQDVPVELFTLTYVADGLLVLVTDNTDSFGDTYTFSHNADGTVAQMDVAYYDGTPKDREQFEYNTDAALTVIESWSNDGPPSGGEEIWVGEGKGTYSYVGGVLHSARWYDWDEQAGAWSTESSGGADISASSTGWILSTSDEYQDPDAPVGQLDTYDEAYLFDQGGYPIGMTVSDRYWSNDTGGFVTETGSLTIEWEEGPFATDLSQLWFDNQGYLAVPGLWFLWMID